MSSPLDAISDVQEILGYEFQNPQLLLEALKTAGAGFNMRRGMAPLDGNKRVAQVGSAVVKVALIDDWYRSMTDRGNLPYPHILLLLNHDQPLPMS